MRYITATYLLLFASFFLRATNPTFSSFIENKGQIVDQNYSSNEDVLFLFSGKGYKVQLRKNGYSYEVLTYESLPQLNQLNSNENLKAIKQTKIKTSRVDIDFYNSNSNIQVIKEDKSSYYLNYFIDGNNITEVYSFNKVTYKNVYPNTDIEFLISPNGSFKYNIILRPGADINLVKFLCKGADKISIESEHLNFITPLGIITEEIPFSYYLDEPNKNTNVRFSQENNIISFVSNYNTSKTLVIDPSSNRIWGTYFGETALEYCTSGGSDTLNNVYIAGYSLSTSNIATSGSYQVTLNGSFDAYLAKFNTNGVQQWGTYFGGTSVDVAYAIFVQKNGIVYISGDTFSTSNVASAGAHQTVYGGGIDDAILAKFDNSGLLLWSTYYGGNMHDISQGVVVDSNGDVIMTGHTESANTSNCIATSGAYSTSYSINYDVFVVKFNSNGVRQWGTYYGDTGLDEGWAITCDASDNIFVTGITQSLFGISTPGTHQTINGGNQDVFIAKFNPAGTSLIFGTYFGGTGDDQGTTIKIDNSGKIFVAGNTTSPNNISSVGAYQTSIASSDDGILACFSTAGARLWSTYFGGNDVDYINSLTIDPNSNLLFCGSTLSSGGISSPGAYQPTLGSTNFYDAYFAKFSNSGQLKLATYYGGSDNDKANAIFLDKSGKVYINGETTSSNAISTPLSHMPVYSGNGDAFLAKFCIAPEPTISPAGTFSLCAGNSYTLSTQGGFPNYLWNTGYNSNPLAVSNPTVAGTYYYTVNVNDGFGCDATTDTVTVIVNLCLSVDELANTDFLSIYPNPATSILSIELHNNNDYSKIILSIYSASGSLISKETISELKYDFDISKLSSGLYFLKIESDSAILNKKFIKE